jgi:hypothetical protein
MALEVRGIGPCLHGSSLANDSDLASRWLTELQRPTPHRLRKAREDLLDGWAAVVDWPASVYAYVLADVFPQSQVVLTTRPAAEWFASFSATILSDEQPGTNRAMDLLMRVTANDALQGQPWSKSGWIAAYKQHITRMRAMVPPERMLVYSVREGWGPLCRFLGVPVPQQPFPATNDRTSFSKSRVSPSCSRGGGTPATDGS